MNEAKQMHDDLLNGLLAIIPRTTYHDIRRLNTLVWARRSPLSDPDRALECVGRACLRAVQSQQPAVCAASPGFLHHPAIHPQDWYAPILQVALRDWQSLARV
jgi:hypothetical protein